MKSPFELLKKNVTPQTLKQKFKKGSKNCPFFLLVLKICDEQNDELKFENKDSGVVLEV